MHRTRMNLFLKRYRSCEMRIKNYVKWSWAKVLQLQVRNSPDQTFTQENFHPFNSMSHKQLLHFQQYNKIMQMY